ncbi:MAG: ABC transporter substrate-binding protein [Candidatus Taylorbacteria bacterium]|nr:ABC transporter substrate-binding protein [Candidatus Taylorbacteria bacterium]
MKKIIWSAVVVIIIVIGWLFTNNKQSKLVTSHSIKIGVIAPLSGPLAEYGEAFQNGIILAQEKLKNNKLQFVFEDSAYDSGKAIAAFNKLKDFDKVNVIINWGDPTSQAIAPLVKTNSIPFIAVTTIPSVAEQSPYIIRTLNRSEDAAGATWEYLRSKNFKNVGIVKLETPYFNSLVDSLIKTKQTDEKVTIIDTYLSFGDKDFRTSISKIKNTSKYDVIGVFLAGGQISQFYKQASTLEMKTPTFGTDFFESQSDIDAAGTTMNGVVYVNYDVSDDFRTEYQNRFKNISQIAYAGNGYDTVMMLNSIPDADKDSVINTLKAVKDYSGVVGKWNLLETTTDRYLSSPFHIKIIQDGIIKTLN